MKTKTAFSIFGITIPAGTPLEETGSCALIARYDESKGCRFDKKGDCAKPPHNASVAVPRSYVEK